MLSIVKKFQTKYVAEKPIIVGDAAMLSQKNRDELQADGYYYIVGARLSNTKPVFLQSMLANLLKKDGSIVRTSSQDKSYEIICTYSDARYKKDKREMDKQIEKAKILLARQEPGRRAKFVKKANAKYLFDESLKQKTELLLGVKGYCTNIPESILSNEKIVEHYHSLWQVEHAFRMSKNDLQARPIFHHSHDAIRAHVLICFMALMMGKYIEIKAGCSLRHVRDLLWQVQEVHLHDPIGDLKRTVLTPIPAELNRILDLLEIRNTH
jgi:transposase